MILFNESYNTNWQRIYIEQHDYFISISIVNKATVTLYNGCLNLKWHFKCLETRHLLGCKVTFRMYLKQCQHFNG
jgi:hypothetical protein